MKNAMLIATSLLFSTTVSAAPWTITGVESGTDGGFGYSSLHDASGSNVMSGAELATITGASGTYDDVTGAANMLFSLSNGDSLSLNGNLQFDGAGWLSSSSSLAYSGLNLAGISSTGNFGYMPNDVCCNGTSDPNSFQPSGTAGLNYLTLWGADGYDARSRTYSGSTIGMDFRLSLSSVTSPSAVPLPAALWMFTPAIIGLLGARRKHSGSLTA